jgi:hypothetical protein
MIFPSDRLSSTIQICVVRADLLDPKLDPTDLCARRTSYAEFFLRIFYGRSSPYWGEPQKILISLSACCQQPTRSHPR